MAKRIQAISAYRPRIRIHRTVFSKEIARFIAERTGLNPSEIISVLTELHHAVEYHCQRSQSVEIEKLGHYTPRIQLDGDVYVRSRVNNQLHRAMNDADEIDFAIENRDNIGLTVDELVAMWNEENPDDPIEE